MSDPVAPPSWKDPIDYALAVEAAAYLIVAHIVTRLLPFRITAGWMGWGRAERSSQVPPERVARAVERAADRFPVRTVCLQRGVAAQRMLRRRGYASQFVYGLSPPAGDLEAHVWVRLDGKTLVGDVGSTGMVEVAVFPGALDPQAGNA